MVHSRAIGKFIFFFNDTATTEIYTLSLHDALAASLGANPSLGYQVCGFLEAQPSSDARILGKLGELERVLAEQFIDQVFVTPPIDRSEEHTSELQSRLHLVCRLLLEQKKLDT